MKDYVAEAIGRTLGVSSKAVAGWELNAQRRGQVLAPGLGLLGMIDAQLQVTLATDSESLRKVLSQDRCGSWLTRNYKVSANSPLDTTVHADITLLHGKETQHIFKALYQTMTVRGRQKKRRAK